MGSDAVAIVASRPATPPPADTADQISAHESWCYSTMGDPECYAHAQDVSGGRLINVDPQSRYPLDAASYHDVVMEKTAAGSAPTALVPAADVEVEKKTLKEELKAASPSQQPVQQ
jgi:hypothetical protein